MDCQQKTIVTILSTMRSGSTLLKALLAEADDVSNLPEVNFQKFRGPQARREIESIDGARILVLKRPAWFHETGYPKLPDVDDVRGVVLVRDAYETVVSLKKMVFRRAHAYCGFLANGWLVRYWTRVVSRIHALSARPRFHLVRYEDLVSSPSKVLRRFFSSLVLTTLQASTSTARRRPMIGSGEKTMAGQGSSRFACCLLYRTGMLTVGFFSAFKHPARPLSLGGG